MKPFLYLSLLVIAACGVKHSSVDYGKTTKADLVSEKGEPEQKTAPAKSIEIYKYSGNENYQIEGDVVTHGFKDPKNDEKSLLYWRHKFRECDTTTRKITEVKGHELPEYELKCSALGTTVIYTEGSEFVSRVIEHEKK